VGFRGQSSNVAAKTFAGSSKYKVNIATISICLWEANHVLQSTRFYNERRC
jgi:hypothetical protein